MGIWNAIFGGGYESEWADIERRKEEQRSRSDDEDLDELGDTNNALTRLTRDAAAVKRKYGMTKTANELDARADYNDRHRAAMTERLLREAAEHVSSGGTLDEGDKRFLKMYGPGGTHNADGTRRR